MRKERDMPSKQDDASLLAHPIAQELLHSPVPVRLAYTRKDRAPRVVPIWFHWNGEQIVLGSPCIGYLGHPFKKVALWPVIVSLFLSARGNSAIDPGGEAFSSTRENTQIWVADHQERHAQA